MKTLKSSMLLLSIFISFILSANETFDGTAISSTVAVDKEGNLLRWENGIYDYFVMFKSLLAYEEKETCLDSSTFRLTEKHVPKDAMVKAAYLVWTGAVDPDKIDEPTDYSVKIAFSNPGDGANIQAFSIPEKDIIASRAGIKTSLFFFIC